MCLGFFHDKIAAGIEAPYPGAGTAGPERRICPVFTGQGFREIGFWESGSRKRYAGIHYGVQFKTAGQIPIIEATEFFCIDRLDIGFSIAIAAGAYPGVGLACETAVGSLIRIVPTVGIVDVLQSGFGFLDFPEQTRLVVPHTSPW